MTSRCCRGESKALCPLFRIGLKKLLPFANLFTGSQQPQKRLYPSLPQNGEALAKKQIQNLLYAGKKKHLVIVTKMTAALQKVGLRPFLFNCKFYHPASSRAGTPSARGEYTQDEQIRHHTNGKTAKQEGKRMSRFRKFLNDLREPLGIGMKRLMIALAIILGIVIIAVGGWMLWSRIGLADARNKVSSGLRVLLLLEDADGNKYLQAAVWDADSETYAITRSQHLPENVYLDTYHEGDAIFVSVGYETEAFAESGDLDDLSWLYITAEWTDAGVWVVTDVTDGNSFYADYDGERFIVQSAISEAILQTIPCDARLSVFDFVNPFTEEIEWNQMDEWEEE